jgi:hypothetical protein|tara:strand:- start:3465 stop:3653 length:189 start_codon:yes stop_codon:yes gene_type:complete
MVAGVHVLQNIKHQLYNAILAMQICAKQNFKATVVYQTVIKLELIKKSVHAMTSIAIVVNIV